MTISEPEKESEKVDRTHNSHKEEELTPKGPSPFFRAIRKDTRTMRLVVLSIIFLIALSISSAFFLTGLAPTYETRIDREFSDDTERQAISIAENLEYPDIINTSRYEEGEQGADSGLYDEDVCPHFVDNEVVIFFKEKIDYLRDNNVVVRAEFEYKVKVIRENSITLSADNEKVQVLANDGEPLYNRGSYDGVLALFDGENNISTYEMCRPSEPDPGCFEEPINRTYEDGFLIEMRMEYSEFYGPLCSYGFHRDQYVLLDQHLDPRWVFIGGMGCPIS